MYESKFAAMQPATTNWLSNALGALIQLEPCDNDAAASAPILKAHRAEDAALGDKLKSS